MRWWRWGGGAAVGETQKQPFELSFNSRLRVDFQGSRVTSDGGLLLVRELDERLGFGELIERHLTDGRGKNTQLPLADLVRQSIYSRLAGYEDVNDAERLSQDPAFRLIGSEKVLERGAALTSRVQSFETELLTQAENLAGLAALNRELVAKGEAIDSRRRVVLDMDSTEIPVYGHQEQSAYNGHFESTCYHPLLLFNDQGDCVAAKLRPGNDPQRQWVWQVLLVARDRPAAGAGQGRGLPRRRGLRPAGDLRGARSAAGEVRDPPSRQRQPGAQDHKFVDPPGGKAELQASGPLQELSLPGSELDQGTPRGGKGGVPLWGVVPAGWLHRDQLPNFKLGGGTLRQPARNSGAMDQRGQAGCRDDAAFLPPLQRQPGAAVAEPDRL